MKKRMVTGQPADHIMVMFSHKIQRRGNHDRLRYFLVTQDYGQDISLLSEILIKLQNPFNSPYAYRSPVRPQTSKESIGHA